MRNLPRAISSAFCASVLAIIPHASAESPSDHDWQAQWIGPAASPDINLNGASWIWTDEPGIDPTRNAKPSSRFFRREIELHVTSKVTSATAMFSADNHFKLVVNGTTRRWWR